MSAVASIACRDAWKEPPWLGTCSMASYGLTLPVRARRTCAKRAGRRLPGAAARRLYRMWWARTRPQTRRGCGGLGKGGACRRPPARSFAAVVPPPVAPDGGSGGLDHCMPQPRRARLCHAPVLVRAAAAAPARRGKPRAAAGFSAPANRFMPAAPAIIASAIANPTPGMLVSSPIPSSFTHVLAVSPSKPLIYFFGIASSSAYSRRHDILTRGGDSGSSPA